MNKYYIYLILDIKRIYHKKLSHNQKTITKQFQYINTLNLNISHAYPIYL
jgi:hypothetical protein